MKFYNQLPHMECVSGDTLPIFTVTVEGEGVSADRMELIVASSKSTDIAVICKRCTNIHGKFRVRLDSHDTSKLSEGAYFLHFRMIGNDGLSYRKLYGSLYVHTVPGGE